MTIIDRIRGADDGEERNYRRRILLLLVLLLVIVGGGFGTFAFTDQNDGPAPQTPTTEQTPDNRANVSLAFPAGATLLRADGVVPGQTGQSDLLVVNSGDSVGRLAISDLGVRDSENEIVGPESAGDDSPDEGELSRNLLVHLAVEYPDGETVSVYGSDGSFVPLAAIEARNQTIGDGLESNQQATFRLEWRVASAAGNEIQSDVTTFSLRLQLREPEETDSS